jgi:hypothetical protein
MISADVIGRRARPGEDGPDDWLRVRIIVGADRLGLSPRAFLTLLLMTPLPPLDPATGEDTSISDEPPPRALGLDAAAPPDERQDMKKISYAVSRSSTRPRASMPPKGQSRSAAAKSSSVVSDDRVAEELAERDRW